MKVRIGFVSNSSSSSFVCLFCGEDVSGMDLCLSEAEMFQCEGYGHMVCLRHKVAVPVEEIRSCLEARRKEYREKHDGRELIDEESWSLCLEALNEDDVGSALSHIDMGEYDVPSILCPICQLKEITTDVTLTYALMLLGRTKKDVNKEIKSSFSTLGEVYGHIKEKQEGANNENSQRVCIKQQ